MTKNEFAAAGRSAGHAFYSNGLGAEAAYFLASDRTRVEAHERISVLASAHMADHRIRSSAYYDAFVLAFMADWQTRHDELPEVKAEQLRRAVDRWVANTISSAETTLASWQKRLVADPQSAFEWSSSAFEAAGKLAVGLTLQEHRRAPRGRIEAGDGSRATRGAAWRPLAVAQHQPPE